MIFMSEILEKEFSVNEMIGVLKWLQITDEIYDEKYRELLEEWREEGYGEVTVPSCKETLLC